MRKFFPEAEVSGYEPLIDDVQNHLKDRHVLAVAVAAEAELIVTANLKVFPSSVHSPQAIEALHPDDFRCDLLANIHASLLRSSPGRPTQPAAAAGQSC